MFNDAIIIDNGTSVIRVGMAGDGAPRCSGPTTVSHLRPMFQPTFLCSPGATRISSSKLDHFFKPTFPIKNGVVQHWEAMEAIWVDAFRQLKVDPVDHPVLLAASAANSGRDREKLAEVFFETFKVPGFHVAIPQLLALHSTGRVIGVVLDIGFASSHIVPIYESYAMPHAKIQLDFGGRHIRDYLEQLLSKRGTSIKYGPVNIQNLKEKFGQVALDSHHHSIKCTSTTVDELVHLPNVGVISVTIGCERFQCTDVLFDPTPLGLTSKGIHEAIYDCILQTDADLRQSLLSNVVIAGGSSNFPGLKDRVKHELARITGTEPKVFTRKDSVFIGGSILADLPTFQGFWASKEEFYEIGPSIVNKKSF